MQFSQIIKLINPHKSHTLLITYNPYHFKSTHSIFTPKPPAQPKKFSTSHPLTLPTNSSKTKISQFIQTTHTQSETSKSITYNPFATQPIQINSFTFSPQNTPGQTSKISNFLTCTLRPKNLYPKTRPPKTFSNHSTNFTQSRKHPPLSFHTLFKSKSLLLFSKHAFQISHFHNLQFTLSTTPKHSYLTHLFSFHPKSDFNPSTKPTAFNSNTFNPTSKLSQLKPRLQILPNTHFPISNKC